MHVGSENTNPFETATIASSGIPPSVLDLFCKLKARVATVSKDGEESLQWSCARALVSQETAKMRCLNFENPPFQGFSIYLRCLFRILKNEKLFGVKVGFSTYKLRQSEPCCRPTCV